MRRAGLFGLILFLFGCAVAGNAVDRTTIEVDGARLFFNGVITSRTPSRFEAAIAAHPDVATVVLMDMPGSLDAGADHRIGRLIRTEGLDTHLTAASEIYSGAVSVFLGGNRRTADKGAVIGVHSWADGFGEGSSYPRDAWEHEDNVAYVRAMLGSDAFYWFTLQAAPSDGIHVMTDREIARFGLLTR